MPCPSDCLFDLLFVFSSHSHPPAQPPVPKRPLGVVRSLELCLGCDFIIHNLSLSQCKMIVLWSELALKYLVLSCMPCNFGANVLLSSRYLSDGKSVFQPFSSSFTLSLYFSQVGSRPVFVHWLSPFTNTLYYNMVQREQILKRKLEARTKFFSSRFSHVYHESILPASNAWISLLFNGWKLCSPLPCWLTELILPTSPSRMTARKLLQCNLKTIKYRTSRWQVTSPSHEWPMSPWHCFSACWATLTKSK